MRLVALIFLLFVNPKGADVRGQVIVSINDGAAIDPIANAVVRLYSYDEVLQTRSNEEGAFSFGNVQPGKYRVLANANGFRCSTDGAEVDVSSGPVPPLKITLAAAIQPNSCDQAKITYGPIEPSRLGRIVCSVRNSKDQSPISGAVVTIEGTRSVPSKSATTNANGQVEFSSIKPGAYILKFSRYNFSDVRTNVWIPRKNHAQVSVSLTPVNSINIAQ